MNIGKETKGLLVAHIISMWITIFGPTFTETNTLTFYRDILQPNMISLTITLICLIIGGIATGLYFENSFQKNFVGQYLFIGVALVSVLAYVIVVLIVLPVNIQQCACLYGFYGDSCQNTCFGSNGAICSGHGECTSVGCSCNDLFQGEFCDSCINNYNYDVNCTACNQGYSLTFSCTKCTTGRDPTSNCQGCLDGYLEDETYNNPVIGCSVCKENYFRPSTDPRIGSYNSFLQYGETCAPCPGSLNCNGHGSCNHFLKEDVNGDFDYAGTITLGVNGNGECICDEGFYGPSCVKGLGYDLENTESICNGNGYITENYKRSNTDIFEKFVGIACVCDENWIPSSGDDACSCLTNSDGECTSCAFGYYLSNGECIICPGGSFTRACNMKNAGGVCQDDGTCACRISYASGGYIGDSCSECANNNFYSLGLACVPCPGAFGDGFAESCGGHGVCMTQKRLNHWNTGDSSDSYDLYKFKIGDVNAKTIEQLEGEIGVCQCFENFNLNNFGVCA